MSNVPTLIRASCGYRTMPTSITRHWPPELYLSMTITKVDRSRRSTRRWRLFCRLLDETTDLKTFLATIVALAVMATSATADTRCRSTTMGTTCETPNGKTQCRASRSGSTTYTSCR